jgi:putrescine importer
VVGLTILLGCMGSGIAAQLAAARLLYGMGRSNALPTRFFGVVHPRHRIPRNNVLFIGAIALIGGLFLSFSLGVEMQNFGALIAFMGVNAAAFLRYFARASEKKLRNLIPPVLGFLICLALWWGLSSAAKVLGSIWMALGIGFGVCMTRGFRASLSFEVPKE